MWPFFDGDDTNVCGFIFSNKGSLSIDFLLATGELPEDEDVVVAAAAAFLANKNILDPSFDASGDRLSSLSDLLFIEAVLLGLVVVVFVDVTVVVCFLENVE